MTETWQERRKHTKNLADKKVLEILQIQELEAKAKLMNNAIENVQENIDNLERKIRNAEHKKKNELETLALTLKNSCEEYCKNCHQCSGD